MDMVDPLSVRNGSEKGRSRRPGVFETSGLRMRLDIVPAVVVDGSIVERRGGLMPY
jgi:hypothetical protein